jgi:hypothetical protein
MSLPLWMTIEPVGSETRLMLTAPASGTALKARLPATPSHSRAVITLLESIALWYGMPLRAVVDADASDVRRHPEQWAMLLGDAPSVAVNVEWVGVPAQRRRDAFLAPMGELSRARRLVRYAATGQR